MPDIISRKKVIDYNVIMMYIIYTDMEKIYLFTKDSTLKKELLSALPKGWSISAPVPALRNAIIFFDIDTIRPGQIRDLSDKNLVIAVTGQKRTEPVMEAVTFGAYEIIRRVLTQERLERLVLELHAFSAELKNTVAVAPPPPSPTCAIVGHSSAIMDTCKKLARLSQAEVPVLITGETGTGKELIAESIAQLSSRFGKPFVVINCAAVPEALLESELFGFEKGSFSGAVAAKEGMLKIADEGCVFFDEVGELPFALQGKLLRFLQTQAFCPIGSTKEVQVNVRVISATNRDMAAMVREGKLREDLYHRLCVASLHIPPLRERKKDILPLVNFFIERYRHTAPRQIKGFTKDFLKKLTAYDWPGNIRELENAVRSALALSKTNYLTTYELKGLGEQLLSQQDNSDTGTLASAVIPLLRDALKRKDRDIYDTIHREMDKHIFDYILSQTRENQSEAARVLGINRLTLRKKMKY